MSLATRESESQVGQEETATLMTEASALVCVGNSSLSLSRKIKASVPVRLGQSCHHLHATAPNSNQRRAAGGDKQFHTLTKEAIHQQLVQRENISRRFPPRPQTAPPLSSTPSRPSRPSNRQQNQHVKAFIQVSGVVSLRDKAAIRRMTTRKGSELKYNH